MRKIILRSLIVMASAALLYLLFYPVPIDPEAWTPPTSQGLTGPYAVNDQLTAIRKMAEGQCPQCEDCAVDSLGNVYATATDGNILVFSPDFRERRILANTGGRPLGIVVDRHHNIFVADDTKGLLWITPAGEVKRLTNSYKGEQMLFLDDIDLAPDSSIIFTEASRKFTDKNFLLDIMEHRPNGNVFRYDLKTGETELLIDSMYFPNGVAVSPDGSFVLINHMNKYSVLKYYLSGDRKGQSDVFVDNLPGWPDGVNLGPDGTVWVSIPTLRVELLDKVLPYPFIRKIFMRMPLPKKDIPYGLILGFDSSGKLVHNLQDPTGSFAGITNTVPVENRLYLGSVRANSIGVFELP
jgi:sugar lactone lactonase YvrE